MTLSLLVSMSLFALAASLSPGPINLLSVSSSARYGLNSGLVFITGATLGFIALFLLIGLSLQHILHILPWLTQALQWLGIAFLLYLSYQLFSDNGKISTDNQRNAPGFITGALMQWLNPKAWLATLSGIAAYIPDANTHQVLIFASVYLPICWLSLGVWVWAGLILRQHVQSPKKMRFMNKTLALLLAFSCGLILL